MSGTGMGVGFSEVAAAYSSYFEASATLAMLNLVSKTPDAIINFVGKSKYGALLRLAAQAGPDALRAAIIYFSQDEDFNKLVIDGAGGEGTYDRANRAATGLSQEDINSVLEE